ncbi:MAG: hypothetical protein HY899_17355 [Deltaproteobacteria bacterium]|nr:hypothetical protein [Deltaproteobacteria bacterium]
MHATRFGFIVAALALASLTGLAGCGAMQGRRDGAREPGIALATSHLTKDGGLRIVAKVETGTYQLGKASISYTVGDPGRAAPLAAAEPGAALDLVRATTEGADVDRGDDEVSFTLDRRALAELADRCLWYRWNVSLDDGSGGGRTIRSDFYRTSRGEAGLPRAAQAPGPDTSFVVPATSKR